MKTIPLKSLAQYKHVKFLMTVEKQAIIGYRFVMLKMTNEIVTKKLKKGKLAKSEDKVEGLDPGWTAEVPQLEVDLEALTGNVIDKYMDALRWILMGDYAGKDAIETVKRIGLKGKVVPGVVHAAYLNSIDAHSEHFEDVTGQKAPEMPPTLVKASFDQIAKRVNRFIDATVSQLRTDVLNAIDRTIVEHNFKALNSAHEDAHDRLPEVGASEAASEAGEAVSAPLAAKAVRAEIEAASEKFEAKWDLAVRGDLAMASAAGTHQALLEIHGKDNPNVKVAWIEMEDERVCSFCKKASKNPDGSHKLYEMSDFQPSGYNYIRKRAEWALSIPPAHPRCRCALVYIPPGFEVDGSGGIRAKAK
jgi:hypothetical protein